MSLSQDVLLQFVIAHLLGTQYLQLGYSSNFLGSFSHWLSVQGRDEAALLFHYCLSLKKRRGGIRHSPDCQESWLEHREKLNGALMFLQ